MYEYWKYIPRHRLRASFESGETSIRLPSRVKNAGKLPSDAAAHIGAEVALGPERNGVAEVVGFGGRKRVDGWVFLVYACISVRHWVRKTEVRVSGTPNSTAEKLVAVAGGDVGLARDLTSLFATELERLLGHVRTSAGTGDATSLQQALHTLRGCAGTLGFGRVADAALAFELRARGGMILAADIADDIERLTAACDDADRAARGYLGE